MRGLSSDRGANLADPATLSGVQESDEGRAKPLMHGSRAKASLTRLSAQFVALNGSEAIQPLVTLQSARNQAHRPFGVACDRGIMGCHHYCEFSLIAQLGDNGKQVLSARGVQVAGRFVSEQYGTAQQQRARNRDPLLLAR